MKARCFKLFVALFLTASLVGCFSSTPPEDPMIKQLKEAMKEEPNAMAKADVFQHAISDFMRYQRDTTRVAALDSVLYALAYMGDDSGVEDMLALGANINVRRIKGGTPLMTAAYRGHRDCVEVLLDAGADVHLRDDNGYTALAAAASANHRKCLDMIMEAGADIEASDNKGLTPLSQALRHGYYDCAEDLIDAGASVNTRDAYDVPLIVLLSSRGDEEGVELLIDNQVDINAADAHGYTALHAAVLCRPAITNHCEEIVEQLLDAKADLTLRNEEQLTAAQIAVCSNRVETLQLFLEAKEPALDLNTATEEGYTLLMLAVQAGYTQCVSMLMEAGADLRYATEEGETALSIIDAAKRTDYVRLYQRELERRELTPMADEKKIFDKYATGLEDAAEQNEEEE